MVNMALRHYQMPLISLRAYLQPFSGLRVWPSVWIVAPDFRSSRSLDLVAFDAEMLTLS